MPWWSESDSEEDNLEGSDESDHEDDPSSSSGFFQFILTAPTHTGDASTAGDLAGIGQLLERLSSRLALQPIGRLDSLLLQVLIARISMAEMEYREQLQDALRVSLEEAQEKALGPPPALEQDIQNLPIVCIANEHLECSDKTTCIVCLEPFKVGQQVKQLPCSHLFCEGCICQWLSRHGTCPLCREEVKDVARPRYSYRMCGFRQLMDDCACNGAETAELCVLPACSHAFGLKCMKVYMWRSQPGPDLTHRMVRCPLCDRANPIHSSLVVQEANQPRNRHRNPLCNREQASWGDTDVLNSSGKQSETAASLEHRYGDGASIGVCERLRKSSHHVRDQQFPDLSQRQPPCYGRLEAEDNMFASMDNEDAMECLDNDMRLRRYSMSLSSLTGSQRSSSFSGDGAQLSDLSSPRASEFSSTTSSSSSTSPFDRTSLTTGTPIVGPAAGAIRRLGTARVLFPQPTGLTHYPRTQRRSLQSE